MGKRWENLSGEVIVNALKHAGSKSKLNDGLGNFKEKKMWIVTREYNDYDQHGEYFVTAYLEKPTFEQLKGLVDENDVTIGKLTRGGGRQDAEDMWYNLHEVRSGEKFGA